MPVGVPAASSARALKVDCGGFGSFHQNGISPQRASLSSKPAAPARRIGTVVVGRTL